MMHLEELEKRIVQIINKNNELKAKVELLTGELSAAKEKNNQLETGLMREIDAAQTLINEKNNVKNSIEHLLVSISALEDAS